MSSLSDCLLLLHPDDNVVIVKRTLVANTPLLIEGCEFSTPGNLQMGHKIARRFISNGDLVLKYGMPIGVAMADIAPGQHVHLNNLASRYTPVIDMEEA